MTQFGWMTAWTARKMNQFEWATVWPVPKTNQFRWVVVWPAAAPAMLHCGPGDGTPLTGGKVAGGVIWQSSLVEKKQDPQVGNLWWRLGTGTGGGIGQTLAVPTRETSMDAGMG